MKRYIITNNDENKEVITGYHKTLKEAQKNARDGETIYEISAMWNARPAIEIDKCDLEKLA